MTLPVAPRSWEGELGARWKAEPRGQQRVGAADVDAVLVARQPAMEADLPRDVVGFDSAAGHPVVGMIAGIAER